jgi:SAM-dependent methyltransferase
MNPLTAAYFTLLDLRNRLDYAIRQRVHFSAHSVNRETGTRPDFLLAYPNELRHRVTDEITRLQSAYPVDGIESILSERDNRENYFYLAMLDEAFRRSGVELPVDVTAADIGPSSWFYVQALYAALARFGTAHPRAVHLTGFEVDAYRLYADFHSRRDHALANIRGLAGVNYVDHGFDPHPDTYDVLTTFFPFVFQKDHLEWGLPGRMFNPQDLLEAAIVSLKPGGLLVIVNQGPDEHEAQKRMLQKIGASPVSAFKMDQLLFSYPLDRYIIAVKK